MSRSRSLKDLAKKYPDKISFSDEDEARQPPHDIDDIDYTRKIDIELEDLRILLKSGKIVLEDVGVELILRRTEDDEEIFKKGKVTYNNKSSGKVTTPARWIGEQVAVIKLTDYRVNSENP